MCDEQTLVFRIKVEAIVEETRRGLRFDLFLHNLIDIGVVIDCEEDAGLIPFTIDLVKFENIII